MVKRAPILLAALIALQSCADDDRSTSTGASGTSPAATAQKCRVDLHGKGGTGTAPRLEEGVAVLTPAGNGEGWGGREWRYAGDTNFSDAVGSVRSAIDAAGCTRVAIHGFSNGGSFAAALICAGETFGGQLVGVLVDDPVTDDATRGCARPDDVPVVVLWTGALDTAAPVGTPCAEVDWTCSGNVVRGIDAFVDDLGVDVTPSPYAEHRRHDAAPQPAAWLDG